jgi:protein AATF/BFR2
LRQKNSAHLGPQYQGARISRAALDESSDDESDAAGQDDGEESDSEEYDDPDEADLVADRVSGDEEIDSDDAFGSSDEELRKKFSAMNGAAKINGMQGKRPVAADWLSSSGDEEPSEYGLEQSEEDEDDDGAGLGSSESGSDVDQSDVEQNGAPLSDGTEGVSGSQSSEDQNNESVIPGRGSSGHIKSRQDWAALMTPVSRLAGTDAERGLAIRQQRRSFDALLNIRIRLQKALVAANSLDALEDEQEAGEEAYKASEEAALRLLNTIDDLRTSLNLIPSNATGQKRKRQDLDMDSPSQDIWNAMQARERIVGSQRRAILNKWSAKTSTTTTRATQRLTGRKEANVETLSGTLDDELLSIDRLVARTRRPRSCAPVQAARRVTEDEGIFDDGDFYQMLLKDLVDQRSADGGSGTAVTTVRFAERTAAEASKNRRQVDRRASKGRKLRYNVHEKLQNFMAPEDRSTWEPAAVDRFFGTLFGQRLRLAEDEGSEDGDEEMLDAEEEGLRLFGS